MGIFLKQHDDLFFNVLNAFDNVNPISFKYNGNGIYDLPRASSVDKYNIYTEYAIIEFKKDTLVVKSLENENVEEIDFHTLDLVELINLYEYINEYIIQSN
jgi:hypothetical protein